MASIPNPIIKLDGLTKQYNKKNVVDNVSLEIPEGCFGLLGPNGAGKTTTILLILGLIRPTHGKIYIMGNEILGELGEISQYIGYLPENIGFYPNFTAREHVDFCNNIKSISKPRAEDTEDLLEWCGLEVEYWDKKTVTYSRGMRQRLGLAQAFTGNPRLVILDEPLSNIDPLGRDDLIQKLKIKRDKGINIILSSHIIQEVEQLANTIALIDKGKILVANDLLSLAQLYDFHEFEITSPKGSNEDLERLFHEIRQSKVLLSSPPVLLSNKIIIQTTDTNSIEQILDKLEIAYYLAPIEGTLMNLYKKIVRSN
jgi:ABC-2 type transport system ATP-binding protein